MVHKRWEIGMTKRKRQRKILIGDLTHKRAMKKKE